LEQLQLREHSQAAVQLSSAHVGPDRPDGFCSPVQGATLGLGPAWLQVVWRFELLLQPMRGSAHSEAAGQRKVSVTGMLPPAGGLCGCPAAAAAAGTLLQCSAGDTCHLQCTSCAAVVAQTWLLVSVNQFSCTYMGEAAC
jgi:hypothetical protein